MRRQQFQDRDPIRGERVRGQRVFEVEQPRQPPLFDQRQAEDRLGLSAAQIVVLGEEVGLGGVIENHAFVRANDIADKGFGTGEPGDCLLAQHDFHLIAAGPSLCLNQMVILRRQYQKAAIRAGILERDRHQPLDQLG